MVVRCGLLDEYIMNILMSSTSLHIPPALLKAVDRRAHALRISRNRFIVRTLENEVARETQWAPGFFEQLTQIEAGDAVAVDELLEAIKAARSRKKAPAL